MKTIRKPFAVIAALAAFALYFSPQTHAVVSLDSCRNMALGNNKTLRMASEAVAGASYERKAAKAAYLPGIDFTGGYFYNQQQIELLGADAKLPTMSFDAASGKYNYNILTGPDGRPVVDPSSGSPIPTEVAVIPKEAMAYDVHNVFAGAFTLTQPIYMGGKIKALNDIAKYGEKLARSSHAALKDEVVYNVDQAYWLVVSLRKKVDLADQLVTLMDSLRYSVQKLRDNGMATRSDLLTVEVKLNEAEIARTRATDGLSLARMALAQLCGLPIDTHMELADEVEISSASNPSLHNTNMADVMARRSDLDVIRQSISMLQGREKLALGAMLPNVAAIGMYSFSNPNVNHGFEKKFGGGFSVGATLTIPLWHWGGNYNHYKAAKSATNAQRLLLEDAEEKVELQVNQARFKFNEAFKTLDMTEKNLTKAEENLRQAQLGFKEGVLTSDDVIAAQTAWVQANSENIDARIGIRLCEVYLSKVLGEMSY
ncbi:MAG: TolC family protein [Muribaculum sp.]|nr:TolC family protein [Muribaculum sp.]